MSTISRNTIWSFISIIGVQLINIITNIILARILNPEIFGVLSMVIVFAGLAFVIQEAGLNSFLIYQNENKRDIISTTFWLNILFSLLIAGIIYFCSNIIANFYDNNQVNTILSYISIGIIFGSLGSTHRALLMKNNQFKDITKIDITAEIISSTFSILLAMYVNPLLAISAKYVIRPLIQSVFVFKYSRIKINLRINIKILKELFLYSSSVLGSQLFMCLNNNIDFILVGRYLGDRLLGIYSIAFQWGSLARYYLSGAVIRVLFPEVSKIQDDKQKMRTLYYKVIKGLAFITFPVCFGLAMVSNDFISFFYGNRWLEVVPILQILLIAGGLSSITVIGGPILRGIGRPDLEMKLSILSFILFTLTLLFVVKYGLLMVALSEFFRVLVVEFVRLIILRKQLGLAFIKVFRSILPVVYSTLTMIFILLFVNTLNLELASYLLLIIKIVLGVVSYTTASYYFNRKEVISIVKHVYLKN